MNEGARILGISNEDCGLPPLLDRDDAHPVLIVGSVLQELLGDVGGSDASCFGGGFGVGSSTGGIASASHLESNPNEDGLLGRGLNSKILESNSLESTQEEALSGEGDEDMEVGRVEGKEKVEEVGPSGGLFKPTPAPVLK